jgi:hypothetical protein
MAEVTTYKCDVCGKLKQEANHWFRGQQTPGRWFTVLRWDCDGAASELHLCGQECVQKAMTKAMQQAG